MNSAIISVVETFLAQPRRLVQEKGALLVLPKHLKFHMLVFQQFFISVFPKSIKTQNSSRILYILTQILVIQVYFMLKKKEQSNCLRYMKGKKKNHACGIHSFSSSTLSYLPSSFPVAVSNGYLPSFNFTIKKNQSH